MLTYRNKPASGLTCGTIAALALILAPLIFFGLGGLLNKVL